MKNFETLEVGKTYKNRKGELVSIIYLNKHKYLYKYTDENNVSYTDYGNVYSSKFSDGDLIELIEDKPLTICEIDAKIAELQELRKDLDKSVEVSRDWFDEKVAVRANGQYKNKGFYLSTFYNWEIVRDDRDCLVLVPTIK